MTAAIYARKSTDQNGVADEAKSVTRQIEHARAYAARNGWIVADEHCTSMTRSPARSLLTGQRSCG
jgi:DNA invertase Pin-like site-specific DNA recombinase